MKSNSLRVEPLVVGPLFSNCYIIWDDKLKDGIVIDPGDDANLILKTIEELGLHINSILVTHGHFDHIGAVKILINKLDADFFAHKDDLFFIQDAKKSAKRWGIEIEQPPNPNYFLEDGQIINVGKFELKVLHTPGHSPGGVCFLYNKMIFCGDTLFQRSIGRTDFRKGSMEDLIKSIKTRLYNLPDDTIVYTGHGPITTIGDEKKFNAFVRG